MEDDAPSLEFTGIFHQDLIDLMIAHYETSKTIHYTPFELRFCPGPARPSQRARVNLYDSPAAIEADADVQRISLPDGYEEALKVVAALYILGPDSTLLAQFGSASLRPIHAIDASKDNNIWLRPTSCACGHLAYVPHVCILLNSV